MAAVAAEPMDVAPTASASAEATPTVVSADELAWLGAGAPDGADNQRTAGSRRARAAWALFFFEAPPRVGRQRGAGGEGRRGARGPVSRARAALAQRATAQVQQDGTGPGCGHLPHRRSVRALELSVVVGSGVDRRAFSSGLTAHTPLLSLRALSAACHGRWCPARQARRRTRRHGQQRRHACDRGAHGAGLHRSEAVPDAVGGPLPPGSQPGRRGASQAPLPSPEAGGRCHARGTGG